MASLTPGRAGQEMLLADETVQLVAHWLRTAEAERDGSGPASTLRRLIDDPAGLSFAMRFVDRVTRPDAHPVAAHQLAALVRQSAPPAFLSPVDRLALRLGAALAPHLPALVMPMARRRMKRMIGHLVVDAEPRALTAHLARQSADGFRLNINLLGEAVLGTEEAERRLRAAAELIRQGEVDYVSVKLTSIVAQLNPWDWDGSLARAVAALRHLLRQSPSTFVNLDMEEYHDLELTLAAFRHLFDEPDLLGTEAGIVLQTYLPDSFAALRDLVTWATDRQERGGASIKIRLVKGANLAMERVEATLRGWAPAPYDTKAEVDANFKRCLDWVLRPDRVRAVRVGVASHNLFDAGWAHLLAQSRGVSDRVEFEMLQGMAPAQARSVRDSSDLGVLLYTPIVSDRDFDVAISYLFRRLEENAAPGNYLRSLFDLAPGTAAFEAEAARFRAALADRWSVDGAPRRDLVRPSPTAFATRSEGDRFINEPDTDPAVPANRSWMAEVVATDPGRCRTPMTTTVEGVTEAVTRARTAATAWASTPPAQRRLICHDIADQLARRRGPLISAMVHEGHKAVAEADPEVSEAIDFARYYGDRAMDLAPGAPGTEHARFEPLGVMAVVPPWNFPVAIPLGGVLAALASGNTVILKPAPEVPRCSELLVEACQAAGLPDGVLQLVRTPDDGVGRALVTSVDGVILTGSLDTARLFRGWKPDLPLFAETSGKNSMVITPHADLDLAVADLVRSAFGHAGQKCSAASLAICVGGVGTSERFRRQLVDAVTSLQVGPADELATVINPLIGPPDSKLARAFSELDTGEEWLVEPRPLDDSGRLWSPGIRVGVRPGSWFHQTECFGPVLGIIAADDLDQAVTIQNDVGLGLTGGLHTLDDDEIERWLDRVEVGNAYVNRTTTGAIVSRQPFGGWKRSSVGPGAKAGGPNYLHQLGRWLPADRTGQADEEILATAAASDRRWWDEELSRERDRADLEVEANLFRYRPLPGVVVRVGDGTDPIDLQRVLAAIEVVGVPVEVSRADEESETDLFTRLDRAADTGRTGRSGSTGRPLRFSPVRIRALGRITPGLRRMAADRDLHVADDPVTVEGRLELRHYLREQAISRTMHRFGSVLGSTGIDP
jgi:RHH-type proline utilization regulon transcriptional repressor/proline dehydrogenase/delta 1-pyrroline-5-carboxylate dehydrogenase